MNCRLACRWSVLIARGSRPPFFCHRFCVTKPDQIEKLRACGVRYVEVEVDGNEPLADTTGNRDHPASPIDLLGAAARSAHPEPPEPPRPLAAIPSLDELAQARQAYMAAKQVVEQAMTDVRLGREIAVDSVRQTVETMADNVLHNPDALTSLSRLKSFDEYTFYHSVNTCILALAVGNHLCLERDSLVALGIGALLHDIGKMAIPLEILNKPGRFTPDEYEIMKQHALRGAETLAATTGLHESCIQPALQHHERCDGSGYPFRLTRKDLSLFGRISSIVDIYDAMTSDRVYHRVIPAYEALRYLYGLGQGGLVDPELVQHFISCVGIYPVGSCVKLNTGAIGIVQAIHRENLLRPVVLLVRAPDQTAIDPAQPLDLWTEPASRSWIAEALAPQLVQIDPRQYLL